MFQDKEVHTLGKDLILLIISDHLPFKGLLTERHHNFGKSELHRIYLRLLSVIRIFEHHKTYRQLKGKAIFGLFSYISIASHFI